LLPLCTLRTHKSTFFPYHQQVLMNFITWRTILNEREVSFCMKSLQILNYNGQFSTSKLKSFCFGGPWRTFWVLVVCFHPACTCWNEEEGLIIPLETQRFIQFHRCSSTIHIAWGKSQNRTRESNICNARWKISNLSDILEKGHSLTLTSDGALDIVQEHARTAQSRC
jgi:hypothetical protein